MKLYSRNGIWKKKYHRDIFLAFVVLVLPFCIYIHLFFQDDKTQYFNLFGNYYHHGFSTTRAFAWFILSKIIPLALCVIWFLVNSKWWRYSILVPIGLYMHSIISFFSNRFFHPEDTLLETLLITILICSFVMVFDSLNAKNMPIKYPVNISHKTSKIKTLYEIIKGQFEYIQIQRPALNEIQYGSRLQHLDNLLSEKFIHKFGTTKYLSHRYPKRTLVDVINLVLIMLCPFIYNTHHLVPSGIYKIEIFGIEIGCNGFLDFNTFYWFVITKFCVLLLMIVWFISSKIWWRYAILSPIILYSYQFLESLQDIRYLDSTSNINVFPAILTVFIVLILLSYNNKFKFGILDIYEQVENELEDFIDKTALKDLNQLREFRSLCAERPEGRSADQYLKELNRLKQKIQYELKANT